MAYHYIQMESLPGELLVEIAEYLSVRDILRFRRSSKRIYEIPAIEKIWANYADWRDLSQSNKLTEQIIEKYIDHIIWYTKVLRICSEEFLEKHEEKINFVHLIEWKPLSENFLERHLDRLDWIIISCCQSLSEEFIEKYSDRVYWDGISKHQKLSDEFIRKHINGTQWSGLCFNGKISLDANFKAKRIFWYGDMTPEEF